MKATSGMFKSSIIKNKWSDIRIKLHHISFLKLDHILQQKLAKLNSNNTQRNKEVRNDEAHNRRLISIFKKLDETYGLNKDERSAYRLPNKNRKSKQFYFNKWDKSSTNTRKEQFINHTFKNPKVMTKDQMIQKIMTKARQMTKGELKKLLTKLNKQTLT